MAEDAMHPAEIALSAAQWDNLARFQIERGIASRDVAIGLLLDIAFEAVSGSGRRYWDNPISGG